MLRRKVNICITGKIPLSTSKVQFEASANSLRASHSHDRVLLTPPSARRSQPRLAHAFETLRNPTAPQTHAPNRRLCEQWNRASDGIGKATFSPISIAERAPTGERTSIEGSGRNQIRLPLIDQTSPHMIKDEEHPLPVADPRLLRAYAATRVVSIDCKGLQQVVDLSNCSNS